MIESAQKAIFMDRDGTLNRDPGYISTAQLLELFPGTIESLKQLKDAGFLLVIVSNQSGVGRGYFSLDDLHQIHGHLDQMLWDSAKVKIDAYSICVHSPDEKCACRKPSPKLIIDIAVALKIDLKNSYMIGDRQTDLKAGRNAHVGNIILVRTGEGHATEKQIHPGECDFVADSFNEATSWILNREYKP